MQIIQKSFTKNNFIFYLYLEFLRRITLIPLHPYSNLKELFYFNLIFVLLKIQVITIKIQKDHI